MSDSIIIPQAFFVGDYQMSVLFESLQFGFPLILFRLT